METSRQHSRLPRIYFDPERRTLIGAVFYVVLPVLIIPFSIFFGLVFLCAYTFQIHQPPASVNSPLIYPMAENVTISEWQERGFSATQTVGFQTRGKSKNVFDFYRQRLTQDGWEMMSLASSEQFYSRVVVGSCWPDDDPTHYYFIEAKEVSAGKTNVRLGLTHGLCH